MTALDDAWDELMKDALADDGPIRQASVTAAIKRNRPLIEALASVHEHGVIGCDDCADIDDRAYRQGKDFCDCGNR